MYIQHHNNTLLGRILPFLWLGLFIILAIVSVIVFSYLLFFGAIIGLVLYAIAIIRHRFFVKKPIPPTSKEDKATKGRIIDYDEIK